MNFGSIGLREQVWRRQLRTGGSEQRAEAALRLGRYLVAIDDAGGRKWLRRAAGSCSASVAPRAHWALAEALLSEGEAEQAEVHFDRADELSCVYLCHEVVLASAARQATSGSIERAIETYRDVLDHSRPAAPEVVAVAAFRLAEIHLDRGETGDAVGLLRKARQHGSGPIRAHATCALADIFKACAEAEADAKTVLAGLSREPENLRGIAETLYRDVIETNHADLAPRAALLLAELRASAGDEVEAEATLRTVIRCEHPVYGPLAELQLRALGEPDASAIVEGFLESTLSESRLATAAEAKTAVQVALREAQPESGERPHFPAIAALVQKHLASPAVSGNCVWLVLDGAKVSENALEQFEDLQVRSRLALIRCDDVVVAVLPTDAYPRTRAPTEDQAGISL